MTDLISRIERADAWLAKAEAVLYHQTEKVEDRIKSARRELAAALTAPSQEPPAELVEREDEVEDEGPIADAARRIASWAEGETRIRVYRAAKREIARTTLPSQQVMVKALIKARDTFRRYERLHAEKGTLDGDTKALANGELAAEMDNALNGGPDA